MQIAKFIDKNPYTPGAGYPPPFLAGREKEIDRFKVLLEQEPIFQNPIVTGLRGIGKTVLLNEYRPLAEQSNWVWAGTELSEAFFVSEQAICHRLLTDLAFFTSTLQFKQVKKKIGIHQEAEEHLVNHLDYKGLLDFYERQPGMLLDKLKASFEFVWPFVERSGKKGIIFAYDEAQVVQDQSKNGQFPLSLMLGLFQSLQSKGMRYMLLLSGLPTLFPRLVNARTYAERMFTVQTLGELGKDDSSLAIENPLKSNPLKFHPASVQRIIDLSGGYPYFIQFICRECFDHFKLQLESDKTKLPVVPVDAILAKLDADFFSGRWLNTSDRQREFLLCVASAVSENDEISSSEMALSAEKASKEYGFSSFSKSYISQIVPTLIDKGLIYKTRYGKYSFAVPMFKAFILRQFSGLKKQAELL